MNKNSLDLDKSFAKSQYERYLYDLAIIRRLRNERKNYNTWTSKYMELTRKIKKVGIISNKKVKELKEILGVK